MDAYPFYPWYVGELPDEFGKAALPVEVKAEDNISGRSLTVYNDRYKPDLRIRYSLLNLQYNSGLFSCPAPLAGWIDKFLQMV